MHHDGSDSTDGGHPGGSPDPRSFDRSPLVVTWESTQACDLTCDHCRAEAQTERDPGELSTADAKDLVDQVASFGHPPPVFVVSGGDPLQRPDIFEILSYAVDSGLPTAVTPAPTENLTPEVVSRFADIGVHRMALSLDGPDPETHDGFRGEAGSYESVTRAAEWAEEFGLGIQINTTVTARTAQYLPAIADRVADLGATMWEVFFLVPVGRGEDLTALSPAAADEALAWLFHRGQEAPYRVITVEAPQYRRVARQEAGSDVTVGSTRAGSGFVFVSHRGEVYPSGFLPLSSGRVPEQSLVDIYRSDPLFERLRDPDGFADPCGSCPYRDVCGGSRSRAFATTGDPLAADPLCPRT
ncbi:radical SAM protein [Halapricum sp. CBA1109]|uniref:radical SAM protein n=1 Tax=Halapricum sp. CBA1109 TaxID=2668068 RepID=UPI0012FBF974|nr:radical SAM protein [Halapricum sp. CBA1109]MUV90749.1 radical SAM protein [Halapricum sp. CBA1109]